MKSTLMGWSNTEGVHSVWKYLHTVLRADQREKNQYNLSLMFTKVDIPQPVIRTVIHDWQYDDPVALSCIMPKKVELLGTAICKPGGTKGGE